MAPDRLAYTKQDATLILSRTMQGVLFFLGCLSLVGCLPLPPPPLLPPTASFNPPTNSLSRVEAHAWLKRVEITDPEMTGFEPIAQIENTLTNQLWRFLRDGKYF